MSRRRFIQNQGATCANWQWSWSFVNERERFVIFGVWDDNEADGKILSRDWEFNGAGRKNPGFTEAIKNISRVKNDGFHLLTFSQFAKRDKDNNVLIENGKITIASFEKLLERRRLFELSDGWYSEPITTVSADSYESLIGEKFEEGARIAFLARKVERDPDARKKCLQIHGYSCKVCDVSLGEAYGEVGQKVIEVHHLKELALSKGIHAVEPEKDLIPVCPNCHTIIHRRRPAYSPDEIRAMLRSSRNKKA